MEPWWEIPKKQETKRMKSTDELDYKMLLLVLRNVTEKYGGVGFWQKQLDKYGKDFFEDRSSATLKQIWKRIRKNYGGNLVYFKNLLETHFDEPKIKEIRRKIKGTKEGAEVHKEVPLDQPRKCKWFMREMNLRFDEDQAKLEEGEPANKMKINGEEAKGKPTATIDIEKLIPKMRTLNSVITDKDFDSKEVQVNKSYQERAGKVTIIRDFENKITHCLIYPLKSGANEAEIKRKLMEFSQLSNSIVKIDQ